MTEVITVSVDIGKPIRCPNHDKENQCHEHDCRFWGECKQADGEFGDEAQR